MEAMSEAMEILAAAVRGLGLSVAALKSSVDEPQYMFREIGAGKPQVVGAMQEVRACISINTGSPDGAVPAKCSTLCFYPGTGGLAAVASPLQSSTVSTAVPAPVGLPMSPSMQKIIALKTDVSTPITCCSGKPQVDGALQEMYSDINTSLSTDARIEPPMDHFDRAISTYEHILAILSRRELDNPGVDQGIADSGDNGTSSPEGAVPAKSSTLGPSPNVGGNEAVELSQQLEIVSTVSPGPVGAPPLSTMQQLRILRLEKVTSTTCSTDILGDTDTITAKRDTDTLLTGLVSVPTAAAVPPATAGPYPRDKPGLLLDRPPPWPLWMALCTLSTMHRCSWLLPTLFGSQVPSSKMTAPTSTTTTAVFMPIYVLGQPKRQALQSSVSPSILKETTTVWRVLVSLFLPEYNPCHEKVLALWNLEEQAKVMSCAELLNTNRELETRQPWPSHVHVWIILKSRMLRPRPLTWIKCNLEGLPSNSYTVHDWLELSARLKSGAHSLGHEYLLRVKWLPHFPRDPLCKSTSTDGKVPHMLFQSKGALRHQLISQPGKYLSLCMQQKPQWLFILTQYDLRFKGEDYAGTTTGKEIRCSSCTLVQLLPSVWEKVADSYQLELHQEVLRKLLAVQSPSSLAEQRNILQGGHLAHALGALLHHLMSPLQQPHGGHVYLRRILLMTQLSVHAQVTWCGMASWARTMSRDAGEQLRQTARGDSPFQPAHWQYVMRRHGCLIHGS